MSYIRLNWIGATSLSVNSKGPSLIGAFESYFPVPILIVFNLFRTIFRGSIRSKKILSSV